MPTSVSAQTTEIVPITPLTAQNEVTHVRACTQTQTHTCMLPAFSDSSPSYCISKYLKARKKNSKKKIQCEGVKINSFICYVFDGSAIQVGNATRSLLQ